MEGRNKILILVGVIVFITTFIVFVALARGADLSPKDKTLAKCNLLKYSGPDAVNVLFISNKKLAQSYSNYFLSKEPFSQNKDSFNFYYIDSYEPKCELYKGIAIFCYSKELIQTASSCPNDAIIVPKSYPGRIRSSAYHNVASININSEQSVLLHEFGHLAGFAEEYVVPSSPAAGSKNCQVKCDSFTINDGCFDGCSSDSYKRSIDRGVMRTLSVENYGKFNDLLLEEKIASLKEKNSKSITGKAIGGEESCADQNYYLLNVAGTGNSLSVIDTTLATGCASASLAQAYSYNVESGGQILEQGTFNDNIIFSDIQSETQNEIEGESFAGDNFYLTVPAIQNADQVSLFNDNGDSVGGTSLSNVDTLLCQE